MKYNTLIKKLSLSEQDLEDIKNAVHKAESKTSGEIVVAVTPESSSYSFWELAASCVTALLFLLCMLPLSSQIASWLGAVFWSYSEWYLTAFFIFSALVMIIVLYSLYNIPWFDRLVIPFKAKSAAVTKRALRCFTESGVYCTKEHSGILIFISYFERQVRIVADCGISDKISSDLWNLISDELTEGIASGKAKDAFITAIEKCGDLLAENFPATEAQENKSNQLDDALIILEDEKWV